MKKIKLYSLLLFLCVGLTACYGDDDIDEIDGYNLVEFEFPQGNDPWDKEIEQIAKDWGMYIIYKNVSVADLNKGWTHNGSNAPVYTCTTPTGEQVQEYLKLVKDWLLSSLDKTKEEDRKQLPFYFYLVNDFHDSNPNSPTFDEYTMLKQDGMDYWSLSFKTAELEAGLTKQQKHTVACAFSYPSMKARLESGEYKVAPDFSKLTNYEDKIGTRYYSMEQWLQDNPWAEGQEFLYEVIVSPYERDQKNAYQHRGFFPTVREDFRLATDFEDPYYPVTCGAPTWMPWIPFEVIGDEVIDHNPGPVASTVKERVLKDFMNTIRYAMIRSREAISEEFPLEVENEYAKKGHETLIAKYDLVVKYMKETYHLDLPKYADLLK